MMAWNFRKSIKIAPGFKINIGKRGTSMTMGPKGAKVTFGSNGTYVSSGLPGTGIFYRKKISSTNNEGNYYSSNINEPSILTIIIGIIIVVVCVVLFFSSFGWDWMIGGSRSFSSYGVHYHKSNAIDVSWTKYLFYPLIVIGTIYGIFVVRAGFSSNNDIDTDNNDLETLDGNDNVSENQSVLTKNQKSSDIQSELHRILDPVCNDIKEKRTTAKDRVLKNATSASKRSLVKDITKDVLKELSSNNESNI